MPIPLRFRMVQSIDHVTPSTATPAVVLWSPGAPTWTAPYGAISSPGDGWWTVAADGRDQLGGSPLLLYATATGADPSPAAYYPDGATWTQGATSLPMPMWCGTSASDGYQPAAGATLAVQVSINGGALAAAGGSVAEPGGTGQGNGFYLYYPSAGEMAAAGDLALFPTSAGVDGFGWDYPIAAAPAAGASTGRERDIRAAIAARLTATGAFDAVILGRLPAAYGAGASRLAAAAILPASTRRVTGWDAAPLGGKAYACTIRVVVMARDEDPDLLDQLAEQLGNFVVDQVDGQDLVAGLTVPQQTEVLSWDWQDTPMPERRIQLSCNVSYIVPWGAFSTAN